MKAPKPVADQGNPYLPQGAMDPYTFEAFEGMNTATLRPGVDDKEAAWLDSFMPLGPGRNLRTMPDIGPALITASSSEAIIFFAFANIGATPIMITFGAGGGIGQVNVTTGAFTLLSGNGTITNPSRLNIGVTSYGNQFVVIVAKQTDGYFIWDGTTFYSPGDSFFGGTIPFGIGGTAIEIYAGRAWIANGSTIYFSAPGSLVLFGSSGGGNFSSTDSFLRVNFIELKQSNGFLYLVADSSINYISGVQTSGSPATTTFTNQNLDPEVGTPWPGTVGVFNRNVIFANAFGAQIAYGGAVSKVSEKLDGVYNTVENFGSFIPSAAKAIVYGKKIWMLLLPIVDPITGQQTNKLFCWNGKIWWAASQSINLQFIATQEINSVLTAWGTDGVSIYPLFQTPSNAYRKIAQSKLWDRPGYEMYKSATRFWGIFKFYNNLTPTITVNIDNETESDQTSGVSTFNPITFTWRNNANALINWTNDAMDPIVWESAGVGFTVSAPEAIGQNGVLIGMTLSTLSPDMAIVSAKIADLALAYRG